ncbi:MAG TPA: response regulator transcription factor [Candidatus Dormibacteraeota bacterium]|nr:response regulator transcription factor [Candidatus Dormibacteraeota bacterium]
MERHHVLVIAANRLLRDLLCDLVAATPEFNLAGSACGTNPAAVELMNIAEDVVVLLWLPEHSTPKQLLDQIGTVRGAFSRLRLVLIGMPAIEDVFLTAVQAGVTGYVLDDAPMGDVLAAVRLVARGEVACPGQLLPALFRCVRAHAEGALSPISPNRFGFSRRERQLVPLIAQGMTNKEIASQLCLSEQTVKNHLRRMMRKAGAPNRFAVVERCQIASAAGI